MPAYSRFFITVATAVLLVGEPTALFSKPEPSVSEGSTPIKEGWNAYSRGEFGDAITYFESALMKAPENQEALFGLGTVWANRRPGENLKLARDYFERAAKIGPNEPSGSASLERLSDWSLLEIATLDARPPIGDTAEISEAERKKAIESYGKIAGYSSKPAQEALVMQQNFRLGLEEPETDLVISTLTEFISKNPESPYRAHAYTVLARAYEMKGDADSQLAARISALETKEIDPNNVASIRAGSYWAIASIAEFKAGNFQVARKYYQLLIKDFPRDQLVFSAEVALKRMDAMEAKIRAEANAPQ